MRVPELRRGRGGRACEDGFRLGEGEEWLEGRRECGPERAERGGERESADEEDGDERHGEKRGPR
jgi:hypothetical protein